MLMRPPLKQGEKSRWGALSVAPYSFLPFHEEQMLGLLFLCCACNLCDFSWNGRCVLPARFDTGSIFLSQYHKRCMRGTISACCPGVGTRNRLGCCTPLAAQCPWHQQWCTLAVQQYNLSHLPSECSCISFVLSLVLSCLSICSLFDNCSQTNLVKSSFGLHCEIPQCQLLPNGKIREFCPRCPASYVQCAMSCLIQIINKGLIILIPVSLWKKGSTIILPLKGRLENPREIPIL